MSGKPPSIDVMRIPIESMFVRRNKLDQFEDKAIVPMAARIRSPLEYRSATREETAMCVMIRAVDGGPLRTFSGGLAHETGWFHSRKSGRFLGWEGETAYELLAAAEPDHSVVQIGTESVAFEGVIDGEPFHYTTDIELVGPDHRITLVEAKRTEMDLRDERLRTVLAFVREVCRRCGIHFAIKFRDKIWADRHHRRNAHLVIRHAFVEVEEDHLVRLHRHFDEIGTATSRGALAAALAPDRPAYGRSLVDACTVARHVRMDITGRPLGDATIVNLS